MDGTASRLVQQCVDAAEGGADFPTVWSTILKNHPSVVGVPVQRLDGEASLLEIPLITGQRIVFGPDSRHYELAAGRSSFAAI